MRRLKFFLAVAREGSTLAAARSLGVNQSTVQRGLADLESQLGQRLVEPLPSGYRLSELGAAVLPYAEGVAAQAEVFAQAVRDLGRASIGIIRLTCPATIADLARHPLIAFEESMAKNRTISWFKEVAPDAAYAARNTSVLGLIYAVKAGVGVAPLPMSLGDAEPDLIRIIGPVTDLTRAWRILTHPDQRHTARISAFFDFVLKEGEALRPILTG